MAGATASSIPGRQGLHQLVIQLRIDAKDDACPVPIVWYKTA